MATNVCISYDSTKGPIKRFLVKFPQNGIFLQNFSLMMMSKRSYKKIKMKLSPNKSQEKPQNTLKKLHTPSVKYNNL